MRLETRRRLLRGAAWFLSACVAVGGVAAAGAVQNSGDEMVEWLDDYDEAAGTSRCPMVAHGADVFQKADSERVARLQFGFLKKTGRGGSQLAWAR